MNTTEGTWHKRAFKVRSRSALLHARSRPAARAIARRRPNDVLSRTRLEVCRRRSSSRSRRTRCRTCRWSPFSPPNSTRTLRLTGAVAYNAFKTTPVITQVGGPVSRILVVPGQQVKEGPADARSEQPGLFAAARCLSEGGRFVPPGGQELRARQDLYEHHAIAQRDLEQAESDRNASRGGPERGRPGDENSRNQEPGGSGQGALLGADSGACSDQRRSGGAAGLAGAGNAGGDNAGLHDLRYEHGVGAGERLPGDLAYVRTTATTCGANGRVSGRFHGKISYVSPALDPNTRTLQARIVVDNKGEKLKRDMYCTVTVTAGTVSNAIAVPDSAVLRDDENQPFVYAGHRAPRSSAGARGHRPKPERPDADY
jgi:cobalt-zinc-cadmium efflux system membrane fusion protein